MRVVVWTATLILLLAGCATPGAGPSPSGSPAASRPQATTATSATGTSATAAATVTIRKSGGIAGVNEALTVDAQGNWTRTTRTGTRSGKLTPEQLAQAAKLATDPRLVAEAQTPRSPTNCADAFVYAVTIQSMTVTYSDCGSGSPPPATTELVRYLEQVTQ